MPRTGLYIQTAAWEADTTTGGLRSYSQPDVSRFLQDECCIGEALGEGSFGAAFLMVPPPRGATPANASWVVKLPRTMLADTPARLKGKPIAAAVQGGKKKKTAAIADFGNECRNAEAILEPPFQATLHKRPGARLVNLTAEQKTKLEDETRAWRALPGYAHLHPLLHYDPTVPMLISARALGTLTSTRTADAFRLPDASEWPRVAEHLSAAVAFIAQNTAMAHMDIKPDNVFVVQESARYVYRLGDYGICRKKAAPVVYFWNKKHTERELCGSPLYNPPYTKDAMTYGQATCFQCFATLLATVHLSSADCFLDDLPELDRVHAIAKTLHRDLKAPYEAAPSNSLLRIVVDALRDASPAAWPTHLERLRALFAPSLNATQKASAARSKP